MKAVATGDHVAFESLLERHLDTLYNYAARLTRSTHAADDLLQETWLTVWQKAGTYSPGKASLSTWLHRILHNKYIDAIRKNRRTEEFDEDLFATEGPDAALSSDRSNEALYNCINELPSNQRAALMLTYAQGFSNKDTATILGISTRACESLLVRARQSVRQVLDDNRNRA